MADKTLGSFQERSLAQIKTAGGYIPALTENGNNYKIPADNFDSKAELNEVKSDLNGVKENLTDVKNFIASDYDPNSGNYAKNDLSWHDGKVYRANDSTSGEWDSSKWDEVPLSSLVSVDSELSSTSERPVQNKAIYAVIGDVETLLADL